MPVDYSRLRFLLGLMLLVVIGGATFTFFAGQAVMSANADMARQMEIIQSLTDTFSVVKDAETGQRGYLLVGDKAYLQPYDRARSEIQEHLDDLGRAAKAGTLDAGRFADIEKLVNEKLTELQDTIRIYNERDADAAKNLVAQGNGKRTMDRLRGEIDGALEQHRKRLEEDRERSAWATFTRTGIFVATGCAEALFCIWAYRRIVAEARRYSDASTELARQKDLLSVTLGSIGDAVMVCDLGGRLTFMNPVAENLSGWSLGEARGRLLADIFRI
ncbi:MAG TPA: CHASE3 domain-containing protein, partial [Phycisphaerae bacterium]|nr:CHASE3 domain-containing protein [Phycisphaerae bacterium]